MLSLIDKLQRKPERVRKHIALLFASSVTGIIIIFWLVSWAQYEPEEVVALEEQEQSPFELLTQGLGSLFSDTEDMIGATVEEFSAPSDGETTEVTAQVSADAENGESTGF